MNRLSRVLTIFASVLVACFAHAAPPTNWSPLLEARTLSGMLNDNIRIIHVTGDYAQGHIPGAVHTPYATFRGPQDNPGQLPPLTELTRVVQSAGLTAETPVVVVHQGSSAPDMGAATRVYWTLKSLGVKDVAVLNGGFAGWVNEGLPVSTDAPDIVRSNFEPQWANTWQAHADEILQSLETAELQLIDSRPSAFYLGLQTTASRAGTIPGAENLSFEQFFEGPQMLAQPQLAAIVSAAKLADKPTVTFCNTGQLGSIGWFVLSEIAGIDNVRLYAESITDWADRGFPMDNESD